MRELAPVLLMLCVLGGLALHIAHRTKLSTVISLLLLGVLIAVAGPNGAGWIGDLHQLTELQEWGINLLMFSIGLEFKPAEFRRHWRPILKVGVLQVATTALLGFFFLALFGFAWKMAGFSALLLTLSSTTIILRELEEHKERITPHGNLLFGISLFQDVIFPLLALTAAWLGAGQQLASASLPFYWGYLILAAVGVVAWFLVPMLIDRVVRDRDHSLFFIAFIAVPLLFYVVSSWLGVSSAVATFLAGLIVGRHQTSYQGLTSIRWIKDFLVLAFFVSLGMLLDMRFVLSNLHWILLFLFGTLSIKFICGTLAALLGGYSLRVGVKVGAGLVQIGELSFVLALGSQESGLLSAQQYQVFVAVAVLSMLSTPLLMTLIRRNVSRLSDWRLTTVQDSSPEEKEHRREHYIIVGWGRPSHLLALKLQQLGYRVLFVDTNARNVKALQKEGFQGLVADIAIPEVLERCGIADAKGLIISISDDTAAKVALWNALRSRLDLKIILRLSYYADAKAVEEKLLRLRAQGKVTGVVSVIAVDHALAGVMLLQGRLTFGLPINVGKWSNENATPIYNCYGEGVYQ